MHAKQVGQSCLLENTTLFPFFLTLLNKKRYVVCPTKVFVAEGLCSGFSPKCLLNIV